METRWRLSYWFCIEFLLTVSRLPICIVLYWYLPNSSKAQARRGRNIYYMAVHNIISVCLNCFTCSSKLSGTLSTMWSTFLANLISSQYLSILHHFLISHSPPPSHLYILPFLPHLSTCLSCTTTQPPSLLHPSLTLLLFFIFTSLTSLNSQPKFLNSSLTLFILHLLHLFNSSFFLLPHLFSFFLLPHLFSFFLLPHLFSLPSSSSSFLAPPSRAGNRPNSQNYGGDAVFP